MTRPGRLCVDIGDPDNNLVDVEKTFERDDEEEEGRRPDYMPVRRGLWPAGW